MTIQGEVCPVNVPEDRRYLLDQGLEAMNRGWKLVALIGKKPIGNNWPNRPITSDKLLVKHIAAGRNLGLLTGTASGVLVLDVDLHKGAHVPGNIPQGPAVRTGGGGLHLYFRMPPNVILRNAVRLPYAGIDVRASGGQVVFPGSIHPESGEMYDWLPGRSPSEIALPDLPQEILQTLPTKRQAKFDRTIHRIPRYCVVALKSEQDRVSNAAESTRNSTLNYAVFKVARFLHEGALSEDDIFDAFLQAARQCGLPEDEARRTIRSAIDGAITKGLAKSRIAALDQRTLDQGAVALSADAIEQAHDFPKTFLPLDELFASDAWRSLKAATHGVGLAFFGKLQNHVRAGGRASDPIPFSHGNVEIKMVRDTLTRHRGALEERGIIECIGGRKFGIYRFSEKWREYRPTEAEILDDERYAQARRASREDAKRAHAGYPRRDDTECVSPPSGISATNTLVNEKCTGCEGPLLVDPEQTGVSPNRRPALDSAPILMPEKPTALPKNSAGSLPTMGGNGRNGREGLSDEFVEDAGPP